MNGLNNLFSSLIVLSLITGCRKLSDGSNDLDIIYPNLEIGKTIVVSSP
jgi:hypothetical protein